MKYSEFEREVEKLGFTHSSRCAEIVVKVHGRTVMGVSTNREYIVDSEWDEFQSLHKKTQSELFDLAYQLAKTPLAEREEEKKYRVKFPTITRAGNAIYLQKDTGDKDPIGVDWSPEDFIFDEKPTDYIFTEQEIKDIDERYLAFKVEVKDE